jgi:hypothetical protein
MSEILGVSYAATNYEVSDLASDCLAHRQSESIKLNCLSRV